MTILKIIFLFLAIWFTTVNLMRFSRKQRVPIINFVLMTTGITGFIALQFNWI